MKNLIYNKIKNTYNFISVDSDQIDVVDNFCLNVIVQLIEYDTTELTGTNKNALLLVDDITTYVQKIDVLQKKYYPNLNLKNRLFITKYDSFNDTSVDEEEDNRLQFDALRTYIVINKIKIIYLLHWNYSDEELLFFISTLRQNGIIAIYFSGRRLEIKDLMFPSVALNKIDDSENFLISFLDEENNTVSTVITKKEIPNL